MRQTDGSIILIGASVRAAAFSAMRAGMHPWCADLFADLDLRRRCPAVRVSSRDYPGIFRDILAHAPDAPWLFTGALENQPRLLRELSRLRSLWGVSPRALIRCRNPRLCRRVLVQNGVQCPDVCSAFAIPSDRRRWLVKPFAGAAGRGIRFLETRLPPPAGRCFLQEFIEGESGSALFLGDEDGCRLLGVSRQLIGVDWLHSESFHYCGSIGPWLPVDETKQRLNRIGETLARCGLRGLFGVDFVLRDGVPWPVEVNPRYTASVEVLEFATGLTALALHRRVFDPGAPELPPPSRSDTVGKAIYYAPRTLTVPADGPWMETWRNPPPIEEMPAFADIPEAGQVIEVGRPVLTFFAWAQDAAHCEDQLRHIAADLDRVFEAR